MWRREAAWAARTVPAPSGCLGTRSSGPMMSSESTSKVAEGFPKIDRHLGPSLPRPAARVIERAPQHAGVAAVEWMRAIDFGPSPLQAVSLQPEAVQERWTRPPSGETPSSGRATGREGSPRSSEHRRRSRRPLPAPSPARPLSRGRRRQRARWARCQPPAQWSHRRPGAGGQSCGRVHVTCSGIGPLGSHGCSFTASATFQVPRSITPSAASMTL